MTPLVTLLLHVSAISLGLFAGAMLTEARLLVPAWRALAPGEFFAWYAANERRLLDFFTPLTVATTLLALASAAAAFLGGHPGRWYALTAALLQASAVATFYLFFQSANAEFAAGRLLPTELARALDRWAAWHHGRTLVSLAAAASSLLAL